MLQEIAQSQELTAAFLQGAIDPDRNLALGGVPDIQDEVHYYHPDLWAKSVDQAAQEINSPVARAYAAGWMTHYATDLTIHPWMQNQRLDFCDKPLGHIVFEQVMDGVVFASLPQSDTQIVAEQGKYRAKARQVADAVLQRAVQLVQQEVFKNSKAKSSTGSGTDRVIQADPYEDTARKHAQHCRDYRQTLKVQLALLPAAIKVWIQPERLLDRASTSMFFLYPVTLLQRSGLLVPADSSQATVNQVISRLREMLPMKPPKNPREFVQLQQLRMAEDREIANLYQSARHAIGEFLARIGDWKFFDRNLDSGELLNDPAVR
ncbi:MAG: zinc dependent phospholipase C family protein [Acidobacteria bacterium]|nr:zinc dependent phospholipase C family protein [Acidobacteriota bacterium]